MGNNLRVLRENAGITQRDVAEALGIRQSAVSMWETGASYPRVSQLPKLAEILKCTIGDIIDPQKEKTEAV